MKLKADRFIKLLTFESATERMESTPWCMLLPQCINTCCFKFALGVESSSSCKSHAARKGFSYIEVACLNSKDGSGKRIFQITSV